MPCNSDHLSPTQHEVYTREVAGLIVYASMALGRVKHADFWIEKAATAVYGAKDRHNELTSTLCAMCAGMTKAEQDRIIYDGRNPQARKLAEWWDNHQSEDARREALEAAEARRQETAKAALAKLTPAEKEALGL